MPRLVPAALAATAALAAAPAAANAAALALDRGCYLAKQPVLPAGQLVRVSGSGFTPGATVRATLGGRPLSGSAQADATGAFAASFSAPSIPGFQAIRPLTFTDDANRSASVYVRLSRLAADFLPSTGDPATLRVRFYVYGFGPIPALLGHPARQPVYLHVFGPDGRRRAVSLVGFTGGPCGYLRTARRPILPFEPQSGRWRFLFTTSRTYRRGDQPQAGVAFVVRTVLEPVRRRLAIRTGRRYAASPRS
jgi:hypothetical protein